LHITEVEIDNFKSFVKKVKIPFFDGFTVISGPNGSGKSNVIDCILFVLALSGSRVLRAEKLTDLINLNSGKNTAEVSITFSDETKVRRRIKRTPGGYYSYFYLNDRLCKQNDVVELLAKYGVKPHGYNVVMQGDIIRIIEMSDLERRRVIDEIAGVAEFDSKKALALQELEIVRERIEREEVILHELNQRLSSLKREREKAITYRSHEEELSHLQACRNAALLIVQERELALVQGLIHEHKNECNRLETEQGLEENELAYIKSDLLEVDAEITRKSGPQYLKMIADLEEAKSGIRISEQAIVRLQKEKETNLGEINRCFSDMKRAEVKVSECTEGIRERSIDRANLTIETATLRAQVEQLEADIRNESRDAESLRERLFTMMRDLESKKGERSAALQRQDLLLEKSRIRTRERERLDARVHTLEDELQARSSTGETAKRALADLERVREGLEREIAKIEGETFAKRTSLERLRSDIRTLEQDLVRLETLQQARAEAGGRALEVVRGMEGVYGTVAQLGRAPPEYTTALNVAAGQRLYYVVVVDDHVASAAIQRLKDERLGRLTFLPLNKLRPPAASQAVKQEGVLGFAINLLEFDERFRDAFRVVFGSTVVVDSLERARTMMGSYRLVTLDGELIEKSGAMTGGFQKKPSKGFGAAVEDDIERIRGQLGGFLEEASLLQDTVLHQSEEADQKRTERRTCSEEAERQKLQIQDVARRSQEIATELTSVNNALAEYAREVEESARELAAVELTLTQMNEEITRLAKATDTFKSSLDSTRIPLLTDQLEKRRREQEETERRLRNKDGDLTDLQRERQHFSRRVEELTEQGRRIQEKNHTIDADIEGAKAQIVRMNEVISQVEDRQRQFSSELSALQKRREEVTGEISASERRIMTFVTAQERINLQISALLERQQTISEKVVALIEMGGVTETDLTLPEIEDRIAEVSRALKELGPVNMLAIDEYETVRVRIADRAGKKEVLSRERSAIIERIEQVETMKYEAFITSFRAIDRNFREIFARLTSGSGHLVLENEENPFAGGLSFAVKPSDKPVHLLSALSGGEKSLVTLAFIFSIQQHIPAPFYAFDEVDMSLDGSNVERISSMIRDLSKTSQFIIVSLRKPMIDNADRILGVTVRADKSTLVTGVKTND
jgi:chromosome segregation protein